MTSKTRSGIIVLGEESHRATVKVSVRRTPGSPVGRQEVEVEFLEDAPPGRAFVVASEVVFKDSEGTEHILQYSGTRWRIRNAQRFLD